MPEVVLVTGGGGFLGRRLVEMLLEEDPTREVRFLARGSYPEVEALGARGLQVDLRDAAAVREAVRGCGVVHHVASKAGYWGPREEFVAVNVDGTRHLLEACVAEGVARFVYTSTPSVIGYERDAAGIEEAPYPEAWESAYGATKAEAERLVLAANGARLADGQRLATVSLRPHLIIGPRDNNLVPRVVERARLGRLRRVGDGNNLVDLTYVDNAAGAHLDAQRALTGPDVACAGKAYFISNDEPVKLWSWVNDFLPRVGVPPVTRGVGLGTAMVLGGAIEWAWRTFGLSGEPPMTRFLAVAMGRSHWYSMAPARRDLGYHVRVSMAEATERTAAWFRDGTASLTRSPAPHPR